ncbi:MAG: hypothetical protein U5K99_09305 [Anaerolineales bacterium]|nr:hypothetical protein [Anaerolineales bacterium]
MTTDSSLPETTRNWLAVSRPEAPARGIGKWMLHTSSPHRLFQVLKEAFQSGSLPSAQGLKTKKQVPLGDGAVYVYTGPYTDRDRVLQLAEELRALNGITDLRLNRPLIFKTDLHNTWCETLAKPGDGYYELLKHNWIYRYKSGKLIINPPILALHQVLEHPPENADPKFLLIRSLLPEPLFAGSGAA